MNYFTSASTTSFKTGRNLTFIPLCSCRIQGRFEACLASVSFKVCVSTHCWRAQTYVFPPGKQPRESVPPSRGWRTDRVRKELATQAWGPELRSLALCERPGTKMWICPPRTGAETGGSQGLPGQPVEPSQLALGSERNLISKNDKIK